MKKRGFTLIELLVVIAVIAILAALLFPVFINARNSGRRSRCMSNLKNIGSAIYMYAGDWNGWIFPRVYNEYWDSETGYALPATDLVSAHEPYVKSALVFRCPNDGINKMPANYRFHRIPSGQPDRISYIYVGLDIWKPVDPLTGKRPRRNITDRQKYKGPYGNQGWLMRDKDFVWKGAADTSDNHLATVHSISPFHTNEGADRYIQGVGSNVLLFDGSVEWRRDWDG